jgi:hypothetical protein
VIPANGFSDSEAVNDAQAITLRIEYDAAPGAVTTIQIGSDPRLTDAIDLDTIPLSATDTVAFWTTENRFNGFIWVENTSTVTINNGGTYEIRSTNPTATAATPINFIVNAGGLVTTTGIASGHSHLGNVALNGGTVTTANDVASYNGENYQLNGTVTVGGSTPSVLGAKDGIALNGSRTFNVGDATGSSAVDLNVTAELEATLPRRERLSVGIALVCRPWTFSATAALRRS